MPPKACLQRGYALADALIGLAALAIALSGLGLFANASQQAAADPLARRQALAIAEATLEEILARPALDPDDGSLCGTPEASRALYDNLCDYNGLATIGAYNALGTALTGMGDYLVNVAVITDGSAALGSVSGMLPDAPTLPVLVRVDVRVRWKERVDLTLSGYSSVSY